MLRERLQGNIIPDQAAQGGHRTLSVHLGRPPGTPKDGIAPPSDDPVETLGLTPIEWAILELLLQHPGQLVGTARLSGGRRGRGFRQGTNCLRFHMVQLRHKLEENPARPRHLITVRCMGHRYQP